MKNPSRVLLVLCIAYAGFVPGGCLLKSSTYPTTDYQPIHSAAEGGDVAKVAELLRTDPNSVNLKTWGGDTPLHLAALHGHADVAKLLLDNGAKVNALNNDLQTPLHFAAQFGFKPVVELLLDHQADINPRDKLGLTPLGRAERWHHPEMADFLRQRGGTE